MYEELVKALRETDFSDGCPCEAGAMCEDKDCVIVQAADAIEELQQIAMHYKGCSDDWYREACEYKAALPEWIPVTERLPNENVAVLTWGKEQSIVKIDLRRNGKWFVTDGVTHWMPCQKPPTDCKRLVTDSNQVQEEQKQ